MGKTLSIEDKKNFLRNEMENICYRNKQSSLRDLNEKLNIINLTEIIRKYIKDSKEIEEYYDNLKNVLLKKRYFELFISFHETRRQQLQNELFVYIIDQTKEQNKRLELEKIINLKDEECKNQLEMINKLLEEEKQKQAETKQEAEKLKSDLLDHKKQIENSYQEIQQLKEKAEEKNSELQSYMKAYEIELDNMKKENDTKLKLNEERLKKEFEEKYNDKIKEELNRKIKEAKNEFERKQAEKESELHAKKKKLLEIFNKEIYIIKTTKIKEILNSLEKNKNKILKKEISSLASNDKLINLSFDLIQTENMQKSALYFLNKFIQDSQGEIKNIEHLNIILVGPSGVGKTTLINTLLELNLKAGYGKPQTEKLEYYTSEKFPILRLADSKGIEKNKTADVEVITKSVEGFIQEQLASNDPDKYIHCVWYCFTGTRLEGSEIEVLEKISKQYTSDKLPVIIVYTMAITESNIKNAKNYITNELNLNNEFIEILAKADKINIYSQTIIIPPKNLDKLVETSLEKCMHSINSSCFESKMKEIRMKISEKFDELMIKLNKNLSDKVEKSLLNLSENSKLENFYDLMKNMILEITYGFFFLNENIIFEQNEGYKAKLNDEIQYELPEVIHNKIKLFIDNYFINILDSVKNMLANNMDIYTKDLVTKIIEKQYEINSKNNNLLEFSVAKEDLTIGIKRFITNEIYDKLKFIALKNSVNNLINPLIKIFGKFCRGLYEEGMNDDKFIQNAKNSIKISFEKLEKEIKDYYNKKKLNQFNENIKDEEKDEKNCKEEVDDDRDEDEDDNDDIIEEEEERKMRANIKDLYKKE